MFCSFLFHLTRLQKELSQQVSLLRYPVNDHVRVQWHENVLFSGHQHKHLQLVCRQAASESAFNELECRECSFTGNLSEGEGQQVLVCQPKETIGIRQHVEPPEYLIAAQWAIFARTTAFGHNFTFFVPFFRSVLCCSGPVVIYMWCPKPFPLFSKTFKFWLKVINCSPAVKFK